MPGSLAGEAPAGLGGGLPPEGVIFGKSDRMRSLRRRVERVAGANVPVLICGESGTGKEVLARLLHLRSPFADGSFVKINCPAIPGTLLESELFGYEKGAFTGAYGAKPGRVELAHHGTLFLDEISELGAALQSKLLQLLQDGHFCRIGAQDDKRVDIRVICATNRQLERAIEAGIFRQDLFYRINVVNISLPPLRERREDIPMLANYFLELHNRQYKGDACPLPSSLMRLLTSYEWPGNIRQLENVIKRYVILGSEEAVSGELVNNSAAHLLPDIPADGPIELKKVTRRAMRELERRIILRVLQANRWNRKNAARALDISYRALLYKLRQAGPPPKKPRGSAVDRLA